MKALFFLLVIMFRFDISYSQCDVFIEDHYVKLTESIISQIPNYFNDSMLISYIEYQPVHNSNKITILREYHHFNQNNIVWDNKEFEKLDLDSDGIVELGLIGNNYNSEIANLLIVRIGKQKLYISSICNCQMELYVKDFLKTKLSANEDLLKLLR